MSHLKIAAAITVTAVSAVAVFKMILVVDRWQREREMAKLRRELERKERWQVLKSKAMVLGTLGATGLAFYSYFRIKRFFRKGTEVADI